MNVENLNVEDVISSSLTRTLTAKDKAGAHGDYKLQCFDKDGNLKWEESTHNLVVNEGLQDMNTQYFKGSTYTAAFYMGLITGPGSGTAYAASDTLASHAG